MSPLATAKTRRIEQSGLWTRQPLLWSSVSLSCVWKAGGDADRQTLAGGTGAQPYRLSGERALTPQALKPPIHYHWSPIPLFTFWNGGNTQADGQLQDLHQLHLGQEAAETPIEKQGYSTTPIRLSLSRKSLTRCRRSASSATEGQKQAKAVYSPAWSTVLTAEENAVLHHQLL